MLSRGPKLILFYGTSAAPVMSAWTPLDLGASLIGWWDASDGDSLTIVSDAVSQWDSQVGGWSLVQATAAARPAYSATGWNGSLPAVTGDGLSTNGDILTSATGPFATVQSVFAVVERGTQDDNAASSNRPIISGAQSSGGARWYIAVARPAADAPQTLLNVVGAGAGASASAVTPFGVGDKAVLFAQLLAADLRARINDDAQGAAGTFGASTATNFNFFGSSDAATHRFAGKIGEVIVMNRAVADEGEYLTVYGYLAHKWLGVASATYYFLGF